MRVIFCPPALLSVTCALRKSTPHYWREVINFVHPEFFFFSRCPWIFLCAASCNRRSPPPLLVGSTREHFIRVRTEPGFPNSFSSPLDSRPITSRLLFSLITQSRNLVLLSSARLYTDAFIGFGGGGGSSQPILPSFFAGNFFFSFGPPCFPKG